MNETLEERIKRLQEEKEASKAANESKLVDEFTGGGSEPVSFEEIAKELEKRKDAEVKSKLTGYRKDTIYIREDIYAAFNALCIKQGQKKAFVNEALSDFIMKKYREMGADQ